MTIQGLRSTRNDCVATGVYLERNKNRENEAQVDAIDADDEVELIDKVTKTVVGTTYPRTMRIEDGVVYMKQTTELKDGVHYFEYGLNMENVDGDDVIFHAAKDINIVIMRPRLFKKLTSAEVIELDKILDPTDYPASDRTGVDKREREIRTLISLKIPREIAEKMIDDPANALDKISEIEEEITDPENEMNEPEGIDA